MKLHIGGTEHKEGWTLVNKLSSVNPDIIGDISDLSFIEEGSVDLIYASHVLEHVPQPKMIDTLKGLYRILKSNGGRLCLSVPDLDILCRLFVRSDIDINVRFHVMRMMYGGQINEFDYHYFGWNIEFMSYYLNSVGFKKLERVDAFGFFQDTSYFAPYGMKISLNISCFK